MPFNTQTKTTDIMMFNSRNLGALIVAEEPHVNEWDEPQFGIKNIGIEEKYGFGVLNEGQAIAVARNVPRSLQREMSTPAGARSSRGSTTLSTRVRQIWWVLSRSTSTRIASRSPANGFVNV